MNNFSGTEKHAFSKIYLIYFPKLVRFAREYVVSIEDARKHRTGYFHVFVGTPRYAGVPDQPQRFPVHTG